MTSFSRFWKSPRTQATIMLITSLLAGIGTYLYLLGFQAKVESENALMSVYVARTEIGSGTSFAEIVSQNLFEVREMPRASLPSGTVGPETQLEASLKTRGILSSGQLLVSSFFTSEARAELGLPIPKAMLAVTISVDEVSRVGNFVLPGSRVVVFATGATGSGNSATKILIPDALVIGIGNQTDINLTSTTSLPSPMVTLALSPQDAEDLVLASQVSRLTLALAYENDPRKVLSSVNTLGAQG
jgi:Flp pilus assembly protein CpaB